jgi:hypothetical protein
VFVLLVEGIRHATHTWVYVVTVYQRSHVVAFSSRVSAIQLAQMLEESGMRFENGVDINVDMIKARLRQRSEMLKTWGADIRKLVE